MPTGAVTSHQWFFEWCPVYDKIGHLCRARKGTLFALVTGSNAVAQFDDEFNFKFRANRLMNWLTRPDQIQPVDVAAR